MRWGAGVRAAGGTGSPGRFSTPAGSLCAVVAAADPRWRAGDLYAGSLLALTLSHLAIVAMASAAATFVAVGAGILVTRPVGAEFLPLSRTIANIGQAFPPVAVLALAVPVVGFGTVPTLLALFLYGLLPIFENTLTGLTGLPPEVIDAADGMGMTALSGCCALNCRWRCR